ncbi:Transcription factor COE2 [Asimina triloba]
MELMCWLSAKMSKRLIQAVQFSSSGGKDFFSARSACSNLMDSCLLLSRGPHVDIYCPPRKRARFSIPSLFADERDQIENESSIDVLPDECLFEIFRRLPESRERSACACVSKHWLALQSSIRRSEIRSPSLKLDASSVSNSEMPYSEDQDCESDGYLTRCLEGKKATDVRLASIAVGTSGHGGLGKLLIRGSNATRRVTDLGLSAIARGCPFLRVLSLWNVPSVSDEGLSEIANGCPMLEKLDLCQCPLISDKGLIAVAQNCPSLTELTIESCLKIGNGSLQAIARSCPKLRSISIKNCPLVGDQGVAALVSASAGLTRIKLEAVKITDVSLAVIGYYGKAVEDLSIASLHCITERGFWALGHASGLQKLKTFTITSCQGVTDLGLEAVGKGCPNLRQLHLRRCSLLSDQGLEAFAKSGASLECLQLDECNRITQMGVVAAISNCGKNLKALALVKCLGIKDTFLSSIPLAPCDSLRSLTIRECPGFGSTGIALVGRLCPRLQHVDFGGLYGATDAGLLALVESCKSGLVKVSLAGCINLSDAVVSAVARLHGRSLQLLNLEGCRKVTDMSLSTIADSCLLLTDLDVSRCTVTDSGLASLACSDHLHLQVLSLSGCTLVSDKGIALLQDIGQSLVGLNLQQCNLVSSGAVELLEEQLWRCDILF